MSVDTDDGRRSKHGYARTRVEEVDLFVSDRLPLYADMARVDVKRSIFGKRLVIDILHKDEGDCPE
ncbi:MAG: hypothetical protein O3B65_03690 [Chloroflexi bacterium]|nr:hypothetical protein [Chloroflexota bacterium]